MTSQGPIGQFEGHTDVGNPRHAGTAEFDAASGIYSVSAAGVNMWDVRDEFHFIWTRFADDFVLRARVEFLGPNHEPHRKAGCIIRAGFADNAPYVDAALHGDGLTSLQFRRKTGAISEQVVSSIRGADVVEFQRQGGRYTMRAARRGEPFATSELSDVVLEGELYVGLFLCSHNPDIVERASFHDVSFDR